MTRDETVALAILATVLVGLASCGPGGPDLPGREVVTPLLQREADTLKGDDEKLDPILRVKATWTIEGLDVTERPDDPDRPWAGTIRFRIQSVMRDEQGVVTTDVIERRFDYVFNPTPRALGLPAPALPRPLTLVVARGLPYTGSRAPPNPRRNHGDRGKPGPLARPGRDARTAALLVALVAVLPRWRGLPARAAGSDPRRSRSPSGSCRPSAARPPGTPRATCASTSPWTATARR